MNGAALRTNSIDAILEDKGADEDAGGFTKTFPDIPCVSQMSGGLSLRLSIPTERLSIPPGSRKGGSNAG